MKSNLQRIPDFDDIVFELRNKKYGAYVLRKTYSRSVNRSLLLAIGIVAVAVIGPYLNMKASEDRQKRAERLVEITMENFDQPDELVAPPPPAPPPPEEVINQARYIPPVVVDSVKPDEAVAFMTADEAQIEVRNEEVVEVQTVKEEVREEVTEQEPFIIVEEMPSYPGGLHELYKWVGEHLQYPDIARENNIQGKVFVRFSVTATGGVDKISITKGVDPELDAEAIRVVKILPLFKPGKQGGIPVPVWFSLPINFQLKEG